MLWLEPETEALCCGIERAVWRKASLEDGFFSFFFKDSCFIFSSIKVQWSAERHTHTRTRPQWLSDEGSQNEVATSEKVGMTSATSPDAYPSILVGLGVTGKWFELQMSNIWITGIFNPEFTFNCNILDFIHKAQSYTAQPTNDEAESKRNMTTGWTETFSLIIRRLTIHFETFYLSSLQLFKPNKSEQHTCCTQKGGGKKNASG